ncbi:MAG: hypothetical protein ACLQFR_23005 [Streptosporangiaceae bacterium]
MAYQPYPTTGNEYLPQRPPPPKSVLTAVRLMYAGAGLSVVGLIVGLTAIGSLKTAILQAAVNAHKHLTASQLHTAEIAGVAFIILTGLIGVGLWLWMARMNQAGKSWARVVATVLFAINTLSTLTSIARPNASITRIFGLLVWLVGAGAIAMLWQRDSSDFFNSQPR